MNKIRIFACEAQPVVVEGLTKILAETTNFILAGSAPTLRTALDAIRAEHPDLILVDQSPGLKLVFQFIADVRSTWPSCQPVLWVNDLAEVDCFRALQLGARGILKKTVPVSAMLECLATVSRGDVWIENALRESSTASNQRTGSRLTPREKEIVHHVCAGMKNKEIGEALRITAGTVKVHLMHIFEKTGVKDRFELAVHGRRLLGEEHAQDFARVEATPDYPPTNR